jgi:hypothetical protein
MAAAHAPRRGALFHGAPPTSPSLLFRFSEDVARSTLVTPAPWATHWPAGLGLRASPGSQARSGLQGGHWFAKYNLPDPCSARHGRGLQLIHWDGPAGRRSADSFWKAIRRDISIDMLSFCAEDSVCRDRQTSWPLAHSSRFEHTQPDQTQSAARRSTGRQCPTSPCASCHSSASTGAPRTSSDDPRVPVRARLPARAAPASRPCVSR